MSERDRVIDAFRNCITVPKCRDCPWVECSTLDNGCVEIPRDLALAVMRMLVEQNPHVMAKDEIIHHNGYIWKEFKGIRAMTVVLIQHGMERIPYKGDYPTKELNWSAYGESWRCWNNEPTEELRKAVAWNDD